jgi:hypothetical protein
MTNSVQKIVESLVIDMPNNKFAQFLNSYLENRQYHIEHRQNAIKEQYDSIVEYYKSQREKTAFNENIAN